MKSDIMTIFVSISEVSCEILAMRHFKRKLFFFALHNTYIDLYIFSPFGPTCWFCNRVLTKSNGKTHDTPITPAIPPFMIFGSNLGIKLHEKFKFNFSNWFLDGKSKSHFNWMKTYANCFCLGGSTVDVVFVVILYHVSIIHKVIKRNRLAWESSTDFNN